MILDKLEELLNFSVYHIDIRNFKIGAQEVKEFEDAVSMLDVNVISFECSRDDFYAENPKYERAMQASQLSAVAKNDVNKRLWQKFTDYKSKYEQLDLTFRGRKEKKEVLVLKIKMLNLFPEAGRDIPCYSDIQNRLRGISALDKEINELTIKSEILSNEIIEKFNAIKNNCNKCYAPWAGNFTGKGEIKFDNGIYYCGELVNGKANGTGEMYYPDATFDRDNYYGEFVNGNCQGFGILVYRNGNVYEGNFRDNYPDGSGKITYKNGDVYEGEVSKGKRNGYGKLTGSEIYEGHWRDDYKAPTVQEDAYYKGIILFNECRKFTQDFMIEKKCTEALSLFIEANNFLNSSDYIAQCKEILKKIESEEKSELSRIRRKKQGVIFLQVFLIAIAFASEFLLSMWLGKIEHVWYTMWGTFAISGIYFAISNRVHENHIAWTVISTILLVGTNIIAVCIFADFYWGIVFLLIFNAAIVGTMSALMKIYDSLQELVCSLKIIPTLLSFGATLGVYILSGLTIGYFCEYSSMWNALWFLPLIFLVYSVVISLLFLWIFSGYYYDDDAKSSGIFIIMGMAIVTFLHAAITIGLYHFSVGIFFFCVLLLVIQGLVWAVCNAISMKILGIDF